MKTVTVRTVLGVVGGIFVFCYPFGVYYGLTRWDARAAGVIAVVLIGSATLVNVRTKDIKELWPVLRIPLAIAVLAALGAVLDDPRFVLALPVLVNLVFLHTFAGSLRGPVPIVERFARMQEPDLSEVEAIYCRRVTEVWSIYFVVNAVLSAALALWGPLTWWTMYTGVLSYVGFGSLFAIEYSFRKYRFRRFGGGLHDRVLKRLLPVRRGGAEER